jgi:hypothetical protein
MRRKYPARKRFRRTPRPGNGGREGAGDCAIGLVLHDVLTHVATPAEVSRAAEWSAAMLAPLEIDNDADPRHLDFLLDPRAGAEGVLAQLEPHGVEPSQHLDFLLDERESDHDG